MSQFTVYGSMTTRAFRALWAAEEVGVAFESVPYAYTDPVLKSREFLAINPNGCIPALQGPDFNLWESMAIAFYLARVAGSPLLPASAEGEAKVLQWQFWVMTEVEKPLLAVIFHRFMYPEPDRVPSLADDGDRVVIAKMAVLEKVLSNRPYLVGEAFTLADLSVAAVLTFNEHARLDLTGFPATCDWLARCLARPAVARAKARQ